MKAKALEIRDRGTLIPALAVDMNPDVLADVASFGAQSCLLRRVGYPCDGRPNILVTHLTANYGPATNDPHQWTGRTMPVAHKFIIEHWIELRDGDVVDVEFILGETHKPKAGIRYEASHDEL